jgi:hypothetical protein
MDAPVDPRYLNLLTALICPVSVTMDTEEENVYIILKNLPFWPVRQEIKRRCNIQILHVLNKSHRLVQTSELISHFTCLFIFLGQDLETSELGGP